MERKSILIILHGAIGDVTRGLSLAVRIKNQWPDSQVTWAVEPLSRALVEGHSAIDRVVVFDRPRGLRGYWDFIRELRQQKYDIVLDLQRHFKSGLTSRLSGGKTRLGFHRKNAKEFNWLFNNSHIPPVENFSAKISHYQKFGDWLGLVAPRVLDFGCAPTAESTAKISALLTDSVNGRGPEKGYVALLLGSSWPSRFWQAEYYIELIRELHGEHQLVSVLIGGKGEENICREILDGAADLPVINLVGKTSLNELFAVFSAMRFAVGPDCGPMHIAAAVGTPVISLWGSTSPKRSAPYGSEGYVLQSTIGCSPCYRRRCPGLGTLCMRDIPPAAVLAQVERVLASSQAVGTTELR